MSGLNIKMDEYTDGTYSIAFDDGIRNVGFSMTKKEFKKFAKTVNKMLDNKKDYFENVVKNNSEYLKD